MASSFSDYADVIFLNPKMPEGYFRGAYEKQAILLPMKACKVLVPYPKDDALNLFQETILKLLKSGTKENGWLARQLSLDISLVDLVVNELKDMQLITKGKQLTDKGKLLLEDESLSYVMKTGYIFYDYVSQTYMDAFVPDDKYKAAGIRKRSMERNTIWFFLDDSVANSKYEEAIVVRAKMPETEITPSPYDILRVCKKQRNRERMLFSGDYSEKNDSDRSIPRNSEKVSLLNDNKNVYVATYITIPKDDLVNKSKMQICYPFGEGLASGLLEPIITTAKLSENEPLKNVIDELKHRQTELTDYERKNARRASKETVDRVNNILSDQVQNHPYVYGMALEVEDHRGHIVNLLKENKGSNWESINNRINDYIISNYQLLAAILINTANRNDYYHDILNQDMKHNADTLSMLAIKCGFKDRSDNFTRYFRLRKGRVISAREKEEVDALIALNLLEANDNNEHPFYILGKQMPDFILEASRLKQLRDEGMHGNDVEYNFHQIESLSRLYLKVATVLLEDLTFNEAGLSIEEGRGSNEVQLKIRKEAENQVDNLFSPNIHHFSGLSNTLVSMLEEEQREGESYPTRIAEVLELILKELCRHRIASKAASSLLNYSDGYGIELLQKMKNSGFVVDEIPYYNLSGITKSFNNYRMGTLGTNFYVWFFSEQIQPDCMLTEMGEKCPFLIQMIIDTIKTREHKGRMEYSDVRLEFLKAHIKECVNKIVDVMIYRGFY